MSHLAVKTGNKALNELSKCLRHFDNLSRLPVSAIDAFEARQAENYIRAIIESNGYTICHTPGKGHSIKKATNH